MTNIPDPNQSTPSTRPDLTNVVFLKNEITTDLIEVGDYTYPFTMFGGTWAENTMGTFTGIDQPGDTVIGHDVWLGRNATVMPGVTVGDGAVIGAHSVVGVAYRTHHRTRRDNHGRFTERFGGRGGHPPQLNSGQNVIYFEQRHTPAIYVPTRQRHIRRLTVEQRSFGNPASEATGPGR